VDPQHRDDLDAIADRISDQAYRRRWQYYVGQHPRVYANRKLQMIFRHLTDSLVENYCALAAQARIDRLEVTGWDGAEPDAADLVWDDSRGPHHQERLYRWSLVHGHAYLLADPATRTLAWNPATIAATLADDDDPDVTRVGGKVWGNRAALYYPDVFVTLTRDHNNGQWQVEDETRNPLGQVPMIRVAPYGSGPVLMDSIAPVQDRVNKLVANQMVAAEFGAFRQRVFFTRQDVTSDDLINSPDTAIVLDPGDAGEGQPRMQETSATDLGNYEGVKQETINALFTIACLPRHMRVNPGSPPSGDAIKADEGPLVQAIREHQREVGEALHDALVLLDVDAEPVWRDPEVNDDSSNAQVVATLVSAGVPWQVAVKKAAGWTDEDVAEAERVTSQATTTANASGLALLQAFDQANPVEANPTPQP
jgi:hypothetical protein